MRIINFISKSNDNAHILYGVELSKIINESSVIKDLISSIDENLLIIDFPVEMIETKEDLYLFCQFFYTGSISPLISVEKIILLYKVCDYLDLPTYMEKISDVIVTNHKFIQHIDKIGKELRPYNTDPLMKTLSKQSIYSPFRNHVHLIREIPPFGSTYIAKNIYVDLKPDDILKLLYREFDGIIHKPYLEEILNVWDDPTFTQQVIIKYGEQMSLDIDKIIPYQYRKVCFTLLKTDEEISLKFLNYTIGKRRINNSIITLYIDNKYCIFMVDHNRKVLSVNIDNDYKSYINHNYDINSVVDDIQYPDG